LANYVVGKAVSSVWRGEGPLAASPQILFFSDQLQPSTTTCVAKQSPGLDRTREAFKDLKPKVCKLYETPMGAVTSKVYFIEGGGRFAEIFDQITRLDDLIVDQ